MLAVVGDLVEDIVVWPEGPLQRGTDNQAQTFRTRGGSAANVAAFAAHQHPTRFIGCVGDDATGDSLTRQLSELGVDVRVQRRGTTGTIIILIEPDGERTMVPDRGAAMLLRDVDPAWIDDIELLHVPTYSFDGDDVMLSTERLIADVQRRGGLISIDTSSTHTLSKLGVPDYLDRIARIRPDFVLANEDEAAFIGLSEERRGAEIVAENPATTFALKAGARPTRVLRAGHPPIVVPVPPISDVRDLTGAGDAFASGFLATFLRTRDLQASCEGGHASAASVLASPGATASIAVIS